MFLWISPSQKQLACQIGAATGDSTYVFWTQLFTRFWGGTHSGICPVSTPRNITGVEASLKKLGCGERLARDEPWVLLGKAVLRLRRVLSRANSTQPQA